LSNSYVEEETNQDLEDVPRGMELYIKGHWN
jgi:hypothetical protein